MKTGDHLGLILGADKIYKKIYSHLSIFEKKASKEGVFVNQIENSDHTILVGCDCTGKSLLRYFLKNKKNFVKPGHQITRADCNKRQEVIN